MGLVKSVGRIYGRRVENYAHDKLRSLTGEKKELYKKGNMIM